MIKFENGILAKKSDLDGSLFFEKSNIDYSNYEGCSSNYLGYCVDIDNFKLVQFDGDFEAYIQSLENDKLLYVIASQYTFRFKNMKNTSFEVVL